MQTPDQEILAIKRQLGYQTYGKPPRQWLNTGSKRLNRVLGAEELGLCYGKSITLGGLHSTAKTLLALFLMGLSQADGAIAALVDMEHSHDPDFAELQGCDASKIRLFQPELIKPKNIGKKNVLKHTKVPKVHVEAAEETFDVVERWMIEQRVKRPDTCKLITVVDSTTAIESEEEVLAGFANQNMRTKMQAPFTNRLTKKFNKVSFNTNCIMIYISQLRINPMMLHGNPEYIPGGKGILYYPSIIAKVKRAPKGGILYTPDGTPYGIASLIVNMKNKVGHGSVEGAHCGFKAAFNEFDWRFVQSSALRREMERQHLKRNEE